MCGRKLTSHEWRRWWLKQKKEYGEIIKYVGKGDIVYRPTRLSMITPTGIVNAIPNEIIIHPLCPECEVAKKI